MKTVRLWLMGILTGIGLSVNAQNFLPEKNSFAFGGGPMWGISDSKGDFQVVAGSPTCALLGLDYRHYWQQDIGIGMTYNYLTGSKDVNKLRCHYLAPTFTYRHLWSDNKYGLWATLGIGYLHYKDELSYSRDIFSKGYMAVSGSLGYEYAIGKGVGMQIRVDMILADFQPKGSYRSYEYGGNHHYYDEYWDSALTYFSLGVALMFGK